MADQHTIEATNWNDLLDALFEGAWDPNIERFRSRFVFRGLNNHLHGLRTSLTRLGGAYEQVETHLLRNFRKYAPRASVETDHDWYWLTLGQHHGLPTRLLDWTYSPLIAMHFATASMRQMNVDGAIWAVDIEHALELAPPRFRKAWRDQGGIGLDIDTLSELAPKVGDLKSSAATPFAVFFEPPAMDARITNQYAIFSALSDPRMALDEWLNIPAVRKHVPHRKIILPATLKWEVRDKLDHSNITERLLFPGLDGLSLWLRRYYSPKLTELADPDFIEPDSRSGRNAD
jgi:hypothetical protein